MTPQGNIRVYLLTLQSQDNHFWLLLEETYRQKRLRAYYHLRELVVPGTTWKGLTDLLKEMLGTNVSQLPTMARYQEPVDEFDPTALGSKGEGDTAVHEGIVTLYGAGPQTGIVLTSFGEAKVHWSNCPRRTDIADGRRFVREGEVVRCRIRKPRVRTELVWEATHIELVPEPEARQIRERARTTANA